MLRVWCEPAARRPADVLRVRAEHALAHAEHRIAYLERGDVSPERVDLPWRDMSDADRDRVGAYEQREFFSEGAISDAERALTKVMSQLDRLCTKADADQVVSRLLRQFDVVTGLSAWSDPRHTH